MEIGAEAITVLPALLLFMLSSYLAFLTFQVVDSSAQKALLTLALGLFLGGLVLAACWIYYWGINKKFQESKSGNISRA
jgi:membrane protease YdiL (CAAX protease family)